MRWGDYIVSISFTLNIISCLAYGAQGHWHNVLYFIGAALINFSIILMRS